MSDTLHLRAALRQAATELREAANVLRGCGLPQLASLYDEAAAHKLAVIARAEREKVA